MVAVVDEEIQTNRLMLELRAVAVRVFFTLESTIGITLCRSEFSVRSKATCMTPVQPNNSQRDMSKYNAIRFRPDLQ